MKTLSLEKTKSIISTFGAIFVLGLLITAIMQSSSSPSYVVWFIFAFILGGIWWFITNVVAYVLGFIALAFLVSIFIKFVDWFLKPVEYYDDL